MGLGKIKSTVIMKWCQTGKKCCVISTVSPQAQSQKNINHHHILKLWLYKMHSICFQPKHHDIMYDVVLVDRVVTGRADKGHTKPILFRAHNPFHRAVTWISSASFNPRLGSHFKWFLGLYKQNDVRKTLCQMGPKVIKTQNFIVLIFFNKSQGHKQLTRLSISFSQSFQNIPAPSHALCALKSNSKCIITQHRAIVPGLLSPPVCCWIQPSDRGRKQNNAGWRESCAGQDTSLSSEVQLDDSPVGR